MSLTRPTVEQVSYGTQQLDEYLHDRGGTKDVYFRTIVAEIPFWDVHTQFFNTTYGQTPYPQAFAFDDTTNELFVLRNAGSPATAHIWVYDVDPDSRTWTLKTVFSTGRAWGESLVIRWVGGVRWLYSNAFGGTNGTGDVYRCDITTYPALYAAVTTIEDFPLVKGYSQMAFDGNTFAVQSRATFKTHQRRYVFELWDADLANKLGEVDFTYAVNGTLVGQYSELRQKSQGVAIHNGHYCFGIGGDWVSGTHDADDAYLHQGLMICGADGRRIAAGLARPDEFVSIRDSDVNGLSYAGNMIENEGLAVYQGDLHALWMCTSPSVADDPGRENEGFIITRELSQDKERIDFRSAARVIPTWDPERYGAILHQPIAAPIDPINGATLDSFLKICTFMKDSSLSQFRFYGTGTLLDLNSVAVDVNAKFVEVLNGNGSTFLITITAVLPAECRTFWLSTNITVQTELTDDRYL